MFLCGVYMKEILILTLYGNNNFGNKLQNYALQKYLKRINNDINVTTIKVKYKKNIKEILYFLVFTIFDKINNKQINKRERKFIDFNNKFINYTDKYVSLNSLKKIKGYDYYIYGSDQIWNPYGAGKTNLFIGSLTDNNISYSASISVNYIPDNLEEKYNENLSKFKYISVREQIGKDIIKKITNRNDIKVLVDPTMLLTSEEWDRIAKKPKQYKGEKFILNYFLGNISQSRKEAIYKIAKEKNCKVINLLDKNDPYYVSGPSEFLWLEKHADLICTDSYHSSVFAILYNRPFVVFDRDQVGADNMGSRIDTLLSKFELKNRKFNGINITKENLEYDNKEAYEILKREREKSNKFLKKALDIC